MMPLALDFDLHLDRWLNLAGSHHRTRQIALLDFGQFLGIDLDRFPAESFEWEGPARRDEENYSATVQNMRLVLLVFGIKV